MAAVVKNNKQEIVLAKGLAIILVVMSHIMAREVSNGNSWYDVLVKNIHLFHMPFFVFISGYLHFKPGRLARISEDWGRYIRGQGVRLLLPFFFMGMFVLTGKLVMQSVMHVSNVPDNPFAGYVNLIWHTKFSAALFLWYIFAIFVYSAASLALYQFLKDRMFLWLALGLAVFLLPPIQYVYLNKLTLFFVFFCLGGVLIHYEDRYLGFIKSNVGLAVSWCVFLAGIALFQSGMIEHKAATLLVGSASIPALHGLCFLILEHMKRLSSVLVVLGGMAFSIYLFNNICIGLTKGVLFMVTDWHGVNFYWFAPVLILAGLIGPMLVEVIILNRIPFIKNKILRN